jgi:hypothetical protein
VIPFALGKAGSHTRSIQDDEAESHRDRPQHASRDARAVWPPDAIAMSGFENYSHEMNELDHEIIHYAAICGVDLADQPAIQACLEEPHATWAEDKARQTLRGLLILRIKLETEMIEQGLSPRKLTSQST